MKLTDFEMERMQSTYENVVKYNMSESGVHPVSLRELGEMGLDLDAVLDCPLVYSQSNGTIALREQLAALYPGASIDNIEVTNGSSEANFVTTLVLVDKGDSVIFEVPNYMQVFGLAPAFSDEVITVKLVQENNWEPDWEEFERALGSNPKMMYISNPNNPTGSVFSRDVMERLVAGLERTSTYLLADEVYQGAELDGNISPSFWGMYDRAIIVNGLSKAYGIPGLRIGWIVGPPDFIAECWAKHDYITIGPGTISDIAAQIAVQPEVRKKLHARTKNIIGENGIIFREWIDRFDGFLEYTEPRAGAMAFVKYNHDIPSLELVQRIHRNQDVLIVPGSHLGMEGYLRIALGSPKEEFVAALELIKKEIDSLR